MNLILLRHGIAHDRAAADCPPDPQRALTEKGVRRTRAAVEGLRALGVRVQAIGSSRLVRALQTAEIARAVLEPARSTPVTIDALDPFGDPEQVLAAALESGYESLLLAGHAPNLDRVLAAALGSPGPLTPLKKAGAAWLDVEPGAAGRLVGYFEPKLLRRIASGRAID